MFFDGQLRYKFTTLDVAVVEQLSNNQADMTLLLHTVHALSENANGSVLVRSLSTCCFSMYCKKILRRCF